MLPQGVQIIAGAPLDPEEVKTLTVVIVGAGAIGCSVAGFLAERHQPLYLVDRKGRIPAEGLLLHLKDDKAGPKRVPVKLIKSLSEAPPPDYVLLAVKNYSLDTAAREIKEAIGDRAIVVGLQNGVENQSVLPRYFSRVAYGVLGYNAWSDAPGEVGYQRRGPILLGTPDQSLELELKKLECILGGGGVETFVTPRLMDAVHSKIILNLANSLTALVGLPQRPLSDEDLFQDLLTGMAAEGVEIVKAAGFGELRVEGTPTWSTILLARKIPRFLSRYTFRRNLKKMVKSSMAQDILDKRSSQSELETLNGYLLLLAEKHKVAAPINRAVYALCLSEFARPDFQPMDVAEVHKRVQAALVKESAGQ